jgi:membrane-bound serine protease (ClpP class)
MPEIRAALLQLVATPDRALLTLVIGSLLIYRELNRPGWIVPGIFGGVAVLTALYSFLDYRLTVLGIVLLSLGLFAVLLQIAGDWFWIPGIAGAILLTLGARFTVAWPWQISWAASLTMIPFAAITIFLLRTAIRGRRNKLRTDT